MSRFTLSRPWSGRKNSILSTPGLDHALGHTRPTHIRSLPSRTPRPATRYPSMRGTYIPACNATHLTRSARPPSKYRSFVMFHLSHAVSNALPVPTGTILNADFPSKARVWRRETPGNPKESFLSFFRVAYKGSRTVKRAIVEGLLGVSIPLLALYTVSFRDTVVYVFNVRI
ncbi:hypothetical protein FB567DRAFT_134633 [Paraphoma chrysanthemicola]|uniref:Uncharacterized protein n=1 Tax=Paraphoma chrysanthemicola TaxID=798071 RepID=A0A8K0VVF8_9PLEO|nr:hypothetical protein FB567DRAFT_134633 [Paraphoma chrysanthemicola]